MLETPPRLPYLLFQSIIGRGGMAVVWRAWHKELRRYVAVKVLDRTYAASGADLRQFMMEVRAMTELHHPGLVQGHGAEYVDGRYCFIMDYVDGYTFSSLLARKRKIPMTDALIICESVASAMKYAWDTAGIIHCDLKPENLMTGRDGNVKVMDLGLCQSTAVFRSDLPDEIAGTPAYISPEQVYGDVKLDCRADIYCLGATLYHLVTGRVLFPLLSSEDVVRAHVDTVTRAPDPRRFSPELSPDFVRFVAGMLVKDRDWRYQTWDDVYNDAQVVEEGGEIPPLPPEAISSIAIDA